MLFKVSYQNPESEEPFTYLGLVPGATPEEALKRAIEVYGHITMHPTVENDDGI